MFESFKRVRLLYIVLAVLLLVGLLPLGLAGVLLSRRSAEELRATEGRYQAQLVQDKARQIELYGQRYRDVVSGVARAFEIAGGIRVLSGQEMGLTIAASVMNGNDVVAAVVAVVSFQEVFKAVQQSSSKSARELLDAGLPVVFVVDQNGKAVAHPDPLVAFSEQPMTDLKVVQDWLETGAQVQSALAPFTLERDGDSRPMLGSYATAELDQNTLLGVIAKIGRA